RRHRPAGRDERPGDAAERVRANTGLALDEKAVVRVGEAIDFGLEADVEAAAPRPGVARADLRRALVRRDDPRRRIVGLQYLPAHGPRVGRPVAERPRDEQVGL